MPECQSGHVLRFLSLIRPIAAPLTAWRWEPQHPSTPTWPQTDPIEVEPLEEKDFHTTRRKSSFGGKTGRSALSRRTVTEPIAAQ